jgi:glutathione synthase
VRFLFFMDPVEGVDVEADTTFAFMIAAQALGHEVWCSDAASLESAGGGICARTRRCEALRRVAGDHVRIGSTERSRLALFDVVFMRTDPPFDVDYLHACHLLELAELEGVFVLNKPAGLRSANEKLFALHFPTLIPKTLITSNKEAIDEFLASQPDQKCVLKPVDGHGGEGVFVVGADDRNRNALIEVSTDHGRRRTVCQAYLPEAREGDKRILLLDGEPLGGILRVPSEHDNRGNIHVGARVECYDLSERDLEICGIVAPLLRARGLWFVGLDVIGGTLTEVNVTSPTGIQELSRAQASDRAEDVVHWASERVIRI